MFEIDVKPEGLVSAICYAPFDKAKKNLYIKGFRIVSLEENILLRMQEGKDANVSKYGNWTREGFVCVPKKGVYLVRNSPILDDAERAVNVSRNEQEFFVDEKQVEKSLEDSVEIPYSKSRKRLYITIPAKKFESDKITNFAFGEHAKDYGEFLCDSMPIFVVGRDYVDEQKQAFVRQVWFCGIGYGSELRGFRDLSRNSGLRGMPNEAKLGETYDWLVGFLKKKSFQ